MSTEDRLSRALHDLADVPGPPSMADAALAGARRRRRHQAVWGTAAGLLAAGAIAAPFALRPAAGPEPFAVGAADPAPTVVSTKPNATYAPDDCVALPREVSSVKEVAEADWPRFVRTTIDALPARPDYVMQSGYDICHPAQAGAASAYAVVNLGHAREHGHLTLNLAAKVPGGYGMPSSCATAPAVIAGTYQATAETPAGELLFCADAEAGQPLVYGFSYFGQITVTAIWPDGRTIWMESIPNWGQSPTINGEELRAAVTDPDLVALIP